MSIGAIAALMAAALMTFGGGIAGGYALGWGVRGHGKVPTGGQQKSPPRMT